MVTLGALRTKFGNTMPPGTVMARVAEPTTLTVASPPSKLFKMTSFCATTKPLLMMPSDSAKPSSTINVSPLRLQVVPELNEANCKKKKVSVPFTSKVALLVPKTATTPLLWLNMPPAVCVKLP